MNANKLSGINGKLEANRAKYCSFCSLKDDCDNEHIGKIPKSCQMVVMTATIIEEVATLLKTKKDASK